MAVIETNLNQIAGVGTKTLEKLSRLDINNLDDLLYHFPTRYIDFSNSKKIQDVEENENVTVCGQITFFQNIYTRSHKNIQKAVLKDNTGLINLIWFNQPYLTNTIKMGDKLCFAGSVSFYQGKKTILAPEYGHFNTGKIIAVYPETKGLGSKWFRKTIQTNIQTLIKSAADQLPPDILKKYQLLDLKTSLYQIHTPKNADFLNQARIRLALDEIISLQAKSYIQKKEWLQKTPQFALKNNPKFEEKINKLIKALPYVLTKSQQQVWQEIQNDLLSTDKPMNRLLQGDVGSGKTIIAILATFLAHLNNTLSLIIAPTEILAQQHFQSFSEILKKFKVPIYLLTGASKIDIDSIPQNSIIVSTHAAIYQKNKIQERISLLIIDEQHKFGVKQRGFLSSNINMPHYLTMSATPIPRTISLTMMGNLDLSSITTLPKFRLPIKTFLVPNKKKKDCYQWIKDQIKTTKCQAFIVCPLIDISESLISVKSAKKEFEYLSKEVFPDLKLALIHGKMKSQDRELIIKKFQQNKINILITTPIIEVGVDIPNATVIIIQSADRFGLAQLHQLRGRVGRGLKQSFCYFFTETNNEKSLDRLEFLQHHTNGLEISEYDLQNRGPGEAFSTLQHGFPSLKLANFSDLKLINLSQKILEDIINHNKQFNLELLIKNQETTRQFSYQ